MNLRITDRDRNGTVCGELSWRQVTSAQPHNYVTFGPTFYFAAEAFLTALTTAPTDRRCELRLDHYLGNAERTRHGLNTSSVSLDWNPTHTIVLCSALCAIPRTALAPVIRWLREQMQWVASSRYPIQNHDGLTQDLATLLQWARRE